MATIDELRALAREIREERQIGGNTGERVGNTFEKVADLLDSTGGDISDIREAVEQLLQDVGFIPRDISRTATDAVFTNSEGELLFWLRAATDTLAGLITAANNNKLIALPTAEELAQALAAKQNRLTFDPQPIEGSTNPVTSDGIHTAIANFVTRSVSDLIYYYTKSETYTKEEVNALVAAIKQFVPVVAQTLPTASADTMYKLYLIPSEDPQEGNIKDEYITIDNGASANPRYTWEKIGSVDIDISGKADIGTVPADVTRTQTDATFVNNNHEPLFYLHQATSSLAGLMTSAEHNKLGALPNAQTLNTKLEGTIYDVSVLHPTSGVGGGNTYASLSAALAVIPQDKRKGGMTVRYVYSYDNKYVRYELLSDAFTTDTAYWRGVVTEPLADSIDLVESGGVSKQLLNNLIIAKGWNNSGSRIDIYGLIPNHKYRLDMKNPNWSKAGHDGVIARIQNFVGENYTNLWYYTKVSQEGEAEDFPSFAEFTIPQSSDYIQFYIRADVGYKLRFVITDITNDVALGVRIGNIENQLNLESLHQDTDFEDGLRNVSTETGEFVTTTSGNKYGNEIALDGTIYSVIYNTSAYTGNFGYAFLNASDVLVSSQKSTVQEEVTIDYATITAAISAGATKLRISVRDNPNNPKGFTIIKKINGVRLDNIEDDVEDLDERVTALENQETPSKHYNVIGSPVLYLSDLTDNDHSVFDSLSDLYAAYDALVTAHPNWFSKETDLGYDASNTYLIRHYCLRYQHPTITDDRPGQNTNTWSDSIYKPRRVIINMSVHSLEKYSTLGGYLAIKEILESTDDWAMFIKNNFILDIVPCLNPWGLENGSSDNVNGENLNRTYFTDIQAENTCMINLIQSLKNIGLVGIIDLHNNGTGQSYFVSKPAYKLWNYYAVLTQQIAAQMYSSMQTVFGTDRDCHFHLWDATGNNGQLHQYADSQDLLGCTFEVATAKGVEGSLLTKAICINIIQCFCTYE